MTVAADGLITAGRGALAASCDVVLDLDRGTLDICSTGMWDGALTDWFLSEMEDVLRRFAMSRRTPRTLMTTIDLRRHSIQARETIERVMPQVPRYHELSLRTAVLLSRSAILRMQAERLLKVDRHRFFTSEPQARQWLATGIVEAEAIGDPLAA